MKKILLILLLFPALIFGQATGKVIADKPAGGAIGTAATTVDVVALFNVNQTTAGQTLTVPNLTNASAGKIIYINNVGSTSFTLSPGGLILSGYGVVLRWTGAAWNVTGAGSGSTNPTSTYIPYNNGGVFSDSWLYQEADTVKIAASKLLSSVDGKNNIDFGNGGNFVFNANAFNLEFNANGDFEAIAQDNVKLHGLNGTQITTTTGIISIQSPPGAGNDISIFSGDDMELTSSNDMTLSPSDDLNISCGDRFNIVANGVSATTVPYLDASKNLVSSATTPTQLGYLSSATGTTGTTSTNLVFSTSPTLVTPVLGTPTSGDLSNCTGQYFTLIFQCGLTNPSDGTTYYSGTPRSFATTTTATDQQMNFGYAFTIIGAVINSAASTPSTNEASTLKIRNITQATSSTVGTFLTNTTNPVAYTATYTGLNISVASSDFITSEWLNPTYVTNPVSALYTVTLMCKKN